MKSGPDADHLSSWNFMSFNLSKTVSKYWSLKVVRRHLIRLPGPDLDWLHRIVLDQGLWSWVWRSAGLRWPVLVVLPNDLEQVVWRTIGEGWKVVELVHICNVTGFCCKMLSTFGPWWWWSSGQRTHLLLRRFEFKSCWSLHFFCNIMFEKNENKQKDAEIRPLFVAKVLSTEIL